MPRMAKRGGYADRLLTEDGRTPCVLFRLMLVVLIPADGFRCSG